VPWADAVISSYLPAPKASRERLPGSLDITCRQLREIMDDRTEKTLLRNKLESQRTHPDDTIKKYADRFFDRWECIGIAELVFPSGFPIPFNDEHKAELSSRLKGQVPADDIKTFLRRIDQYLSDL
jgi:hypothetical protein